MAVELNHTIIPARDKRASAKFLADILNLEAGLFSLYQPGQRWLAAAMPVQVHSQPDDLV
jgi:hypothetical protein